MLFSQMPDVIPPAPTIYQSIGTPLSTGDHRRMCVRQLRWYHRAAMLERGGGDSNALGRAEEEALRFGAGRPCELRHAE